MDSPTSFGDTHEQAIARPDSFWQERAARNALGRQDTCYVAVTGDRWLGMLSGYYPGPEREVATLVGLWVDPAARGMNLGARLFDALGDWAREQGSDRMQLWVTAINDAAIALYRRIGFVEVDERRPLASDPSLDTILFVRKL